MYRQISSRETDQELQEQEFACLASLLKDEEFQQSTSCSGKLEIFPVLDPPIDVFIVTEDELQSTFDQLREKHLEDRSGSTNTISEFIAAEFFGSSIRPRHLPSLQIIFWYPENYPSEVSPNIKIFCPWMVQETLDRLENYAKDLWAKKGRLAVLYDVFLLLSMVTNKPDLFPLGNVIMLTPSGRNGPLAKTCANVLEVADPSYALETLRLYDEQRAEQIFHREQHQCPVCFMTRPGTDFMKLRNCKNFCCLECLKDTCALHILEGTVKLIQCLVCGGEIHPLDVASCVPAETFERYQRLLLNTALDCMGDVVYCPRPGCNEPVIVEDKSNVGQCRCGYVFCTLCKRSSHGIAPCQVIGVEDLEKKMAGLDTDKEYLRERLRGMIADAKCELWKESHTKYCPVCWTSVEKNHGCNHMRCTICKAHFCWTCLKKLPDDNPLRHFNQAEDDYCGDLYQNERNLQPAPEQPPDADVERAAEQVIDELLPMPELWFNPYHLEQQARIVAQLARQPVPVEVPPQPEGPERIEVPHGDA